MQKATCLLLAVLMHVSVQPAAALAGGGLAVDSPILLTDNGDDTNSGNKPADRDITGGDDTRFLREWTE